MADDNEVQSSGIWPLVKFQFSVKIDTDEFFFQEVSGLSPETQVIEYRSGNNGAFSTAKMPGIKKFNNIILKKGFLKGDTKLWDKYYNLFNMNTIERKTVVISLLDEANAPVLTWTLSNASPKKITVSDMRSDAIEVAVEIMELAYEGLTIG